MSTVILIRAGRTDYDDQHRVMGTLDMPVNDRGNQQIREVIRLLQGQDVRLEAILTSPDDPACSTARAIASSQPHAKLKELEELVNVNQGLWQGLPESDIRKRHPRLFKSGKEDVTAICPPEGETLSDACERLQKVLTRSIRKYAVLAIVAPEPLATVIRCTLQHRRPVVTACLCGEETQEPVQFIETDSFELSHFMESQEVPTFAPVTSTAGESPDFRESI
jgi:phosphoserine phosphatase